jgi:hypothetical protein
MNASTASQPTAPATDLVASPAVKQGSGWKGLLLAGELPYLAALILCGGAFAAGQHTIKPRDRVAVAEKSAIVLEALLARPNTTEREIDTQLRKPIIAVFKRYAEAGYTVIDAAKDEAGNLTVVALPADAIDITPELRRAVAEAAAQGPSGQAAGPSPVPAATPVAAGAGRGRHD